MLQDLTKKLDNIRELYFQLVIVVGKSGSGKTKLLKELGEMLNSEIININLELSKRMLDIPEKQRPQKLLELLKKIVNEASNGIVIFDNIEIIFDVNLKQDPLRLLKSLSRVKAIVASWNGFIENGALIYAAPDHPEYRKYPPQELKDIIVFEIEDRNDSRRK